MYIFLQFHTNFFCLNFSTTISSVAYCLVSFAYYVLFYYFYSCKLKYKFKIEKILKTLESKAMNDKIGKIEPKLKNING